MTDRKAQLGKLVPLLEAAFRAKQSELSQVMMRMANLQSQIYALDHPQYADHDTPAMRAGANLRWDTWVENRKLLISRELIDAARQRETLRGQVAQAMAKAEAARKLFERTKAVDQKVMERRSSW